MAIQDVRNPRRLPRSVAAATSRRRRVPGKALWRARPFPGDRHHQRQLSRARPCGARPPARALGQDIRDVLPQEGPHRLLSVGRVPARPHLGNNLVNLGTFDAAKQAMEELELDFAKLLEQEEEPGLGNGGLGRLAACYLDSLATLQIPRSAMASATSTGSSTSRSGTAGRWRWRTKWLRLGNPWEIPRPEIFSISSSAVTRSSTTTRRVALASAGCPRASSRGIAHDTPILGYRVNTANLLRLWSAEAVNSFGFESFNVGDYYGAVAEKVASETISKVLYPNDSALQGKQLRLEQQHFFVSCALQDMLRIHRQTVANSRFPEKYAVQLNDTHPALAVAELMRLLVDEHGMEWSRRGPSRGRRSATNHTLLRRRWRNGPVGLFGSVLPRHLEIVYEINRRLGEVAPSGRRRPRAQAL